MNGEALANAYMKAETKAKRRVTLSICGLGMLDETEVETIPDAKQVTDTVTTHTIDHTKPVLEGLRVVEAPKEAPKETPKEKPVDLKKANASLDEIAGKIGIERKHIEAFYAGTYNKPFAEFGRTEWEKMHTSLTYISTQKYQIDMLKTEIAKLIGEGK